MGYRKNFFQCIQSITNFFSIEEVLDGMVKSRSNRTSYLNIFVKNDPI